MVEVAEDAFLFQSVQSPTRGNDVLDPLFTNNCDIHTCEIGESLINSDHNIVRIILNVQNKIRNGSLLIHDYKKKNFRNIKRDLESVN